jgi:hypothetical protein
MKVPVRGLIRNSSCALGATNGHSNSNRTVTFFPFTATEDCPFASNRRITIMKTENIGFWED